MRTRVLLDCDGVLADFKSSALDLIERFTGRREVPKTDWDLFGHMTPEARSQVEEAIYAEGWCHSLRPFPDAQEAVREMLQVAEVYIVTTPYYRHKTWCYERTLWLYEHFGIPEQHVIFARDKHLVQGDVFVDDKPAHVRDWREHHPEGQGIMWSGWLHERNMDMEPYRTQDWGDVLKYVL